jgi:acetyltransferase-like isoleucine patch superfamily enzyme
MSGIPFFSLQRVVSVIFLRLQELNIWPGCVRCHLLRLAGVNVGKNTHIGGGNLFDSIRPDLISVGDNTTISVRCVIVSHFVKQKIGRREWFFGKVIIGENVYLGANVVICHPVRIGDNSAVAAGAVVTKDIPAGEIWGGVPARFIKRIEE